MNESLSLQDLILLSSYLDDRLTPAEKERVEARAAKDPGFLSSLEELRYTRRMLRSLPQKRAPRNFTLSAKTFPQRHSMRLQPVFGFTSAIAAALTILIFAGSQLLPGFLSAKTAAAPMLAAAPAAETNTFDASRSATGATAVPPLILWNGGGYGMGGGGGGAGGSGQVTGIGGGAGPIGGGAEIMPTSTPPAVSSEELAKANPKDLILGVAPQADQGVEMPAPGEAPVAKQPAAPLTTAAILEISLASLALISALLAVVLRRRS